MDNVIILTAFFPASEKHAKIQQDPVLPPTSFIIWGQNTQKVCSLVTKGKKSLIIIILSQIFD